MGIDFDLIENVGNGIVSKFQAPEIQHPLLSALARLGVSQKDIATALGVSSTRVRQLQRYGGFLCDEEEWELCNLLMFAHRCALKELWGIQTRWRKPVIHPLAELVARQQVADLEEVIRDTEKVIEGMLALVDRWTLS